MMNMMNWNSSLYRLIIEGGGNTMAVKMMTTEQARKKYPGREEDLLGATSSYRCISCGERVWHTWTIKPQVLDAVCPYCGDNWRK